MTEICFWPETIKRWRKEGLPEDVEPLDFFGMDTITQFRFDCSLRLPEKTLEDTPEWRIIVNKDGVTVKSWKNNYATPLEMDFAIKTREDWERVKKRLDIDWQRYSSETVSAMCESRQSDRFVTLSPIEPCWYAIRTIGLKETMELMLIEPEFIEDVIATQTDFIIAMLELGLIHGLKFDAVWFFADLCYKNGMLFSPEVYRKIVMPYHKKISAFCSKHGLFLILHCDGDVRQFLPYIIEAGFDCIQPLEARAGNDVRELKKKYGRDIAFFGNINMDVLARGCKSEIEEEVVSKILSAKEGGGYIFHSDHSVPPTVSFESYWLTVDLARKYGTY
jgi:uroporphyrinogen decarboxylase